MIFVIYGYVYSLNILDRIDRRYRISVAFVEQPEMAMR